jgi:hypothetical protein
LRELGLDQQSSERLIENRPYRNKLDLVSGMILTDEMYAAVKDKIAVAKLDLVSRMILTDEMYAAVKDKIAVAKGRESIKIA